MAGTLISLGCHGKFAIRQNRSARRDKLKLPSPRRCPARTTRRLSQTYQKLTSLHI